MPDEQLEHSAPATEEELEERLSRPTPAVVQAIEALSGDIVVLGAGGKMGPSLCRMLRRALDALGRADYVVAVSRFSSPGAEHALAAHGILTVRSDLADRDAVARLPDAPNVVYMAGQKFGTSGAPAVTWALNAVVPAIAAERYAGSTMVAFSTGNVYPLAAIDRGGSREDDPVTPLGEYANSCVARERVLEYFAERLGSKLAIVRLNYAVDLRYGVLVDIAARVMQGEPIDVRMGWVNVIWQGDATAQALQSFAHASSPPFVLNVTGKEILSVRAVAQRFEALLGKPATIDGRESLDALLSDTSRARELFGEPSVNADRLIGWVADWVGSGRRLLSKPTHFETRDGQF